MCVFLQICVRDFFVCKNFAIFLQLEDWHTTTLQKNKQLPFLTFFTRIPFALTWRSKTCSKFKGREFLKNCLFNKFSLRNHIVWLMSCDIFFLIYSHPQIFGYSSSPKKSTVTIKRFMGNVRIFPHHSCLSLHNSFIKFCFVIFWQNTHILFHSMSSWQCYRYSYIPAKAIVEKAAIVILFHLHWLAVIVMAVIRHVFLWY